MSFPSTLGDRLFELRAKRSRKAFAQQYSIHEQTLIRYEKNIRTPEEDFIRLVSQGEGVCEKWLLKGDGPKYAVLPATVADKKNETDKQHIEFIDKNKRQACDVAHNESMVVHVLQENAALLRQNGDLRVEVERQRARIAELERQLEAAQPVKAVERLEQENRRLRERVRELEQELDRIILHMPPPTSREQQALPGLGSGEK